MRAAFEARWFLVCAALGAGCVRDDWSFRPRATDAATSDASDATGADGAGGCGDTSSSRAHCGRCDHACDAASVCIAGACTRGWVRDYLPLHGFAPENFDAAADAAGNLYFAGIANYPADLGGPTRSATDMSGKDVIVWSLDRAGAFRWQQALHGRFDDFLEGFTVNAAGDVFVGVRFLQRWDFGDGAGVPAMIPDWGSVLVSLDTRGALRWQRMITIAPDPPDDIAEVRASRTGRLLVVGLTTAGARDYGDRTPAPAMGAGTSAFMASYAPEDGAFRWIRRVGVGGAVRLTTVGEDDAGNLYAAGSFTGAFSFAGRTVRSAGQRDMLVVAWDAWGNERWVYRHGDTGDDYARSLAVAPGGELYLSESSDPSQARLVSLTPNGVDRWVRVVVPASARRVVLDADDNTFWALGGNDTLDLGDGPTTGGSNSALFASYAANGAFRWGWRAEGGDVNAHMGGAIVPVVDSLGGITLTFGAGVGSEARAMQFGDGPAYIGGHRQPGNVWWHDLGVIYQARP